MKRFKKRKSVEFIQKEMGFYPIFFISKLYHKWEFIVSKSKQQINKSFSDLDPAGRQETEEIK